MAHGNVGVATKAAFLHVAVAHSDVAQDRAQLVDIGLGLVGGANVRLGDDLDKRDAGAIEIDERIVAD